MHLFISAMQYQTGEIVLKPRQSVDAEKQRNEDLLDDTGLLEIDRLNHDSPDEAEHFRHKDIGKRQFRYVREEKIFIDV